MSLFRELYPAILDQQALTYYKFNECEPQYHPSHLKNACHNQLVQLISLYNITATRSLDNLNPYGLHTNDITKLVLIFKAGDSRNPVDTVREPELWKLVTKTCLINIIQGATNNLPTRLIVNEVILMVQTDFRALLGAEFRNVLDSDNKYNFQMSVLFPPPHHCIYSPIEMFWGYIKMAVARGGHTKFTVDFLHSILNAANAGGYHARAWLSMCYWHTELGPLRDLYRSRCAQGRPPSSEEWPSLLEQNNIQTYHEFPLSKIIQTFSATDDIAPRTISTSHYDLRCPSFVSCF